MTEPISGPTDAQAEAELARRNLVWGWALFALFCILFGGTFVIGLAYLWLD